MQDSTVNIIVQELCSKKYFQDVQRSATAFPSFLTKNFLSVSTFTNTDFCKVSLVIQAVHHHCCNGNVFLLDQMI